MWKAEAEKYEVKYRMEKKLNESLRSERNL
jgi:hypothetical protein